MPRFKMVCRHCGSEDVLCDAFAVWDIDSQQWELQNTFDKGSWCNNCDSERRIDSVEITDEKEPNP